MPDGTNSIFFIWQQMFFPGRSKIFFDVVMSPRGWVNERRRNKWNWQ